MIIISECEKERRRKLRIVQVRNQTNEFSKRVLTRVRKEQENQMSKIAREELAKFIKERENALAKLEREYQNALANVGMGHKGIKEQEEYEEWKRKRQNTDKEIARLRGEQAMKEMNNIKLTENKIKENKMNLRKSILLTERLRAAEMRADETLLKGINKVRVIEINANTNEKKVRFIDKGKVVPSSRIQNETVRRIPLGDISVNGVEAAIREQEVDEEKRWKEEKKQIEIARIRGEAALRKAREEKENQSYFEYQPYSGSEYIASSDNVSIRAMSPTRKTKQTHRTPTLIKSKNYESQQSNASIPSQLDLDHTPVRGPSSKESSSGSTSSISKISPRSEPSDLSDSPIVDSVITRHPPHIHGRPMMGGPESAFKDPRVSTPSPKSPKDMETIGTPTEGSPKTKEGNRDFISKVLENFDFVPEGGLKIKVDVQELSTINSILSVTQEHERTSQGEVTRTTLKSSTSLSSSSSIDITKEKFLSEHWKQRQDQDTLGDKELHGLIRRLGSQDNANLLEVQRQNELRSYIERLLQMKRNEIDDLSISDVSSLSFSNSSSIKESSASQNDSPQSSLGESNSIFNQEERKIFKDLLPKDHHLLKKHDVNRVNTNEFVSSTPTSILSSSDSKSSASKSVRFADEILQSRDYEKDKINNLSKAQEDQMHSQDRRGSFESKVKLKSPNQDEMDKQRNEIMNRTRISLSQIRSFYEAQRIEIELELQKRRLGTKTRKGVTTQPSTKEQHSKLSPRQLSEGPLSSESFESQNVRITHIPDKYADSSNKESSLSSNSSYMDNLNLDLNELSAARKLLTEKLNKTSSSGATTSSSNATAELLSRIRRLKMPALQHPPESFWETQRSKDSTSVDRHTSIAGTSNDVVKSDRKNQQEYELPFATDVRELVKDQNILGENERKKAEQNLGVSETMSFSSFHLSEQEMVGKLSAEYSSISLSSESNDNT